MVLRIVGNMFEDQRSRPIYCRFYWFSVAQPLVLQPYSPPTYPNISPRERSAVHLIKGKSGYFQRPPVFPWTGIYCKQPSFRRFSCCFLYQTLTSRLQERRFGEAWGFSTRALLVHSSGRGRRIKVWERALCYLVRAEAQERVKNNN